MNASTSPAQLPTRILELLTEVAPDVDPATVDPDLEFRQQFDFDSMDMLHFVIALNKEYGIEIPEQDYQALRSLSACSAYVAQALAAQDS